MFWHGMPYPIIIMPALIVLCKKFKWKPNKALPSLKYSPTQILTNYVPQNHSQFLNNNNNNNIALHFFQSTLLPIEI